MSDASLQVEGDGRCRVRGDLDFDSVPRLWSQLQPQLGAEEWVLDLGQVRHANSAGLALLLQAHAETRRRGGRMRLSGLPAGLSQLAAMSGLTPLLDELQG